MESFRAFLQQDDITKNVILTGLRGVGKTVLMDDAYMPLAQSEGWVWAGSDFSESTFLNEGNLCIRLLTDLSVYTSSLTISAPAGKLGFGAPATSDRSLSFDFLATYFEAQPGLVEDKLKATLEFVWSASSKKGGRGIVLAYDEAQVVSDRKDKDQYPLAVLLGTFQSLQRRGAKYLLLLTGLPTLFSRLVESRTYAERMFTVQEIGRLTKGASRDAIGIPLQGQKVQFSDETVEKIIEVSDGYPYFIQFICRETFDFIQANPRSKKTPIDEITRKLDSNFFAARWETLTDRQRDLLYCIAQLDNADGEFTIQEIVDVSKSLRSVKRFEPNDVSQILPRLIEKGLVFKNRYSKYLFAVPLFSRFIGRRYASLDSQRMLF